MRSSLLRSRFPHALIAILVLLSIAGAAGPAWGDDYCPWYMDCSCTITHGAFDVMGDGYQKGYVVNTFGGNGCKPMADAMIYIMQTGPMRDPYTHIDGVVSLPPGNFIIADRGSKLMKALPIDCVPWKAYVRMECRGSLNGIAPGARVTLGDSTIDHSGEAGFHADELSGCAPLMPAKPGGRGSATISLYGGELYLYAGIMAQPDTSTYQSEYKHAILDPWLEVDPDWPYADLFEVTWQACPDCPALPLRRDWMTVWEDAATPAMATADNAVSATWVDVDNDGDLDLHVLTGGGTPDRLYVNDGLGGFTESAAGPLADTGPVMSCAWGDYDNDGKQDVLLVKYGAGNTLLHNEGGFAFADSTPPSLAVPGEWISAAWADYDLDGDLDLYVTACGFNTCNRLYVNEGTEELTSFTDVTPAPIGDCNHSPAYYRCGLSASWADYDGDGDPDLALNSYESAGEGLGAPGRLYRNEGRGNFTEATPPDLASRAVGIGSAWGDYDNDLDLDFYRVVYNGASRVLRNNGAGQLPRQPYAVADDVGPAGAVAWDDFDQDGDLDLYVGYGGGQGAQLAFYRADVDSFATSFMSTWGPIYETGSTSSVAAGDYDGDGDIDLAVTGNNRVFLFRNDSDANRHWLQVDLVGVESNRYGFGANIRVFAGGKVQMREVSANPGFRCGSSLTADFGLGDASVVDSIEVRWPLGEGHLQTLTGPFTADRKLTIREGASASDVEPGKNALATARLFPCRPNPFRVSTTIRFDLPERAPVWLQVHDVSGRLVRTLESGTILDGGQHELLWDRRDDNGRTAGAGVYFVRMRTGSQVWTNKMVLVGR